MCKHRDQNIDTMSVSPNASKQYKIVSVFVKGNVSANTFISFILCILCFLHLLVDSLLPGFEETVSRVGEPIVPRFIDGTAEGNFKKLI
jgi:hypothetical protein